ncbi:DUF4421 domain-containing protein [Sediminitomix flava]|uniref:Uncharacterized protein DUF4421 n=1 Tax=Sediminitomix flava TaxID=379075 RepID=A0A315ZH84_SEDFL|nr:DUF4421 domain-containing protein [Sediminitomix flava]PWJ44965.1 uncharacterized protein DUF4421 [Sediminitomix flava]
MSCAQDTTAILSEKDTSVYYISYIDSLTTRLLGVYKVNSLIYLPKDSEIIAYLPNKPFNIGIGADYRWLGLNIAFNFPFINNDNDRFGDTQFFDAQFNLYSRKFVADLFFQVTKGYYLNNPDDLIPDWDSDEPYLRPDLRVTALGVDWAYIFNHEKYSYRAAFTQNEWQLHSTGTPLLGGYLNSVHFDADSSLIPFSVRPELPDEANVEEGVFINLGISFGYAHSFVIKEHWFTNFSLVYGFGMNVSRTYLDLPEKTEENYVSPHMKAIARVALGYNSHKWYIGGSSVLQLNTVPTYTAGSSLYLLGNFRINLVRRFNLNLKRKYLIPLIRL